MMKIEMLNAELEELVHHMYYVSVLQLNLMMSLIVVPIIYVKIPNFVTVTLSLQLGIEKLSVPRVELVRMTSNVCVSR